MYTQGRLLFIFILIVFLHTLLFYSFQYLSNIVSTAVLPAHFSPKEDQ